MKESSENSSGRQLRLPLPVRMSNEGVGIVKGSGSSGWSMGSLKKFPSQSLSSPPPLSSPSKILPFLYVGNQADANDLRKLLELNISFILNLTSEPPAHNFEDYGIKIKRLPVADHCKENLIQHFEEAFNFIGEWRTIQCFES